MWTRNVMLHSGNPGASVTRMWGFPRAAWWSGDITVTALLCSGSQRNARRRLGQVAKTTPLQGEAPNHGAPDNGAHRVADVFLDDVETRGHARHGGTRWPQD